MALLPGGRLALAGLLATPARAGRAPSPPPAPAEEATGLAPLAATPPPGLDHAAETCARCHRRTARQWAGSGHAAAFTSPRFQAAWSARPQGWCVHCHAPLQTQQDALNDGVPIDPAGRVEPREGTAADEGVACAACHLRGGTVRSPGRPLLLARLAHPVEEDPALTDGRRCAGCHQFAFPRHSPAWPFAYSSTPLQDTHREWAASGPGQATGRQAAGCVDCHWPRGHHGLPGATQPGLVEQSLSVTVVAGCGSATAALTATGAAHAVPTGDPFRALELRLCPGDCAETAPVARLRLGRAYAPTAESWVATADTRIPPAGADGTATHRATLPLDAPVGAWELWLQLADARHAALLAPADQGRVVARGAVTPAGPCGD